MSDAIVNLLPVLTAAALVPIYPIVALILLQSENGLKKAIALMTGGVSLRLLQGILFGFVFGRVAEEYPEEGPEILVSTLLLVIGIMLLIKAYTTWNKEDDPETSFPQWMNAVTGVSIIRAATIGALYVLVSPKQWVFTQSALGIIIEAALGKPAAIGLYLLFVAGTQILVLVPILMIAITPQQAAQPLQAAYDWLARHNRTILIVVSLIFGVWFTFKGINGML